MTEVEKRIQKARDTGSDSLDLTLYNLESLPDLSNLLNIRILQISHNQIRDISPLQSLINLTKLDISHNQIQNISPLQSLVNLTTLYIENNQIQDISPLQSLVNLTTLEISNNRIQDISPLQSLVNLTKLEISNNRIQDISPLQSLVNLTKTTLDISHNQIQDISPLQSLVNLTTLYISNNKIQDISPLQSLVNLTTLYISNNKIQDITPLESLVNLTKLHLHSNKIEDISPLKQVIEKGIAVKWNSWGDMEGIYLMDNPLKNPPIATVQQGNEAILKFWKENELYGEEYVYEAKVLLLGEGGHGKTSLLAKLKDEDNALPTKEEQTLAIDISPLMIANGKGQEIQMNVWDFGGQSIYQSTHQFFLTESSVYVLLHNTREGTDNYLHNPQFVYWLEVAKLYGGSNMENAAANAKVLVFQNEENNTHKEINLPEILQQFPQVQNERFAVNLGTLSKANQPQDWQRFRESLEYAVRHLPHLQTPISKRWFKVKVELERRQAAGEHLISLQTYLQEICAPLEMDEDNALFCSRFLHNLGVCLHYQDKEALCQNLILEKTWATKGVYKFFDDEQVKRVQQGRMYEQDRKRLWADDKYKFHRPALLDIMEKFELCYPLDERRDAFLIPQLLPAITPQYEWEESDNLVLRYEYHFLPKDILSRMIVRLYKRIADNAAGEKIQWKTGVVLTDKAKATFAEMTELYTLRCIQVRLSGVAKKELLAIIRAEMDDLHDEYKNASGKTGLQVEEFIPCNCGACHPKHFFDYGTLIANEEAGVKELICKVSKRYAKVNTMLHGTFMPKYVQVLNGFLSKGKYEDALDLLATMTGNHREVSYLQGRLSSNKKERSRISQEDYTRNENLISSEIQDLVSRLDEDDTWQYSKGGDYRQNFGERFYDMIVKVHSKQEKMADKLQEIHTDTQAIKIELAAHQRSLLSTLEGISQAITSQESLWEAHLAKLEAKQTDDIQAIIREITAIKEEEGNKGIQKLLTEIQTQIAKQEAHFSQNFEKLLQTTQRESLSMDTQLKLKIPLIPELFPGFPSLELEHNVVWDSGTTIANWWGEVKKRAF